MKNEKIKLKEEQLIEMVSAFCEDFLNEEYKQLCVNLVKKMGRKHDVPFKRGKLENWASGIIYAIAQINFLFDKSLELHTSPDEICAYFNTKKSTASNKARDIREMFNMGHFDEEFSTESNLKSVPKFFIDEKSGLIIPEELVETDPMDDFFDEVYGLSQRGQIDKAISMLDSISPDSPEYGRALFYKSMILADEGDEDEGFNLLQQALFSEFGEDIDLSEMEVVNYDNPQELFDRGIFSYELDDFEEAIEFFDMALELKPDFEDALYFKSLSLARIDEFKKALEVINKAIKLNLNNDKLWNDKANFLVKLNRFDEAYVCFDKAIELNPTDDIIWSNKAFAYLENDDEANALDCYEKACELNPDDVHPIVGKANVYMVMGDFDNAQKCFDLANEIDEYDIEYLTNYGQFFLVQQKFHEAIAVWDKCLEIDEELPMIWLLKGMAYVGLSDDVMFEECINKACELDPMTIFALDDFFDDMEEF